MKIIKECDFYCYKFAFIVKVNKHYQYLSFIHCVCVIRTIVSGFNKASSCAILNSTNLNTMCLTSIKKESQITAIDFSILKVSSDYFRNI